MSKKKNDISPEFKKQTKKKRMEKGEKGISAIIASFREELASKKQNSDIISIPSPRLHSTLTPNPLNNNELVLFGGEYYDGSTSNFYADFIKYSIKEKQWKSLPYGPPPRSSHQSVATPQGYIYVFGGECASSKESEYYHYKDFWKFDMKTLQWQELQSGPPPRSGHRMILWKHYLVLYGGFFDTHNQIKYYDDLWIYDLESNSKWIKSNPSANNRYNPSSRSGFVFLSLEDCIFMYGGYVKTLVPDKNISKGIVLNDAFILKLNPKESQHCWESIKISGLTNSYPRSGISGTVYNNKIYLFGGISDSQELDEDDSTTQNSECFQDLRLVKLQDKKCFTITITNNDINPDILYINNLSVSHDINTRSTIALNTVHPRSHAMIAIQSNNMFIYGGKYEKQDREYTLDDLYQLNLDKMNGFICLQQSTIQEHEWIEESDSDSSDSLTDESDEMEIDDDSIKNGESLKEFFDRTCQIWIDKVTMNNDQINSKSIRSEAFKMAKMHYESIIK